MVDVPVHRFFSFLLIRISGLPTGIREGVRFQGEDKPYGSITDRPATFVFETRIVRGSGRTAIRERGHNPLQQL
jgi:hypothetical protein